MSTIEEIKKKFEELDYSGIEFLDEDTAIKQRLKILNSLRIKIKDPQELGTVTDLFRKVGDLLRQSMDVIDEEEANKSEAGC